MHLSLLIQHLNISLQFLQKYFFFTNTITEKKKLLKIIFSNFSLNIYYNSHFSSANTFSFLRYCIALYVSRVIRNISISLFAFAFSVCSQTEEAQPKWTNDGSCPKSDQQTPQLWIDVALGRIYGNISWTYKWTGISISLCLDIVWRECCRWNLKWNSLLFCVYSEAKSSFYISFFFCLSLIERLRK